jgi:gliding motility-associatede transport system auxiliary component
MVNRILGIVGWIGTALVFGSVAIRVLKPEWAQYGTWAAWAGLVCVLLYMAGQWRDVVDFYKRRQARYGTMSIVGVLVALGIVVAINYLAVRQNKRWDLTANQVYSLSDQTVKILKGLDAPVKFTVYDKETEFDRFRDRLEEYAYNGKNVSVDYVDVDRNPARAKAAQIQSYGTIVIEYKDRVERLSNSEEQDITNALIKVVTGQQRKLYFTQGHGEKDTAASDRQGYSGVSSVVSRDNYGVEKIVLAQTPEVPADATALIIAGPRTDLLQPEIDAIKKYVARGGKLLVLLDPIERADADQLTNLTSFLKDWGIEVGNDIVVDASGIGQLLGTDASVPVAAQYPPHPITERFGLMTAYPLARSVKPIEGGSGGHTAQAIVETSPKSWAEADVKALVGGGGRVEFNADKGDKQGPISLGAAVSAPATEVPAPLPTNTTPGSPAPPEPPKPESRIVAIGDSDFAANFGLGIQGNRDLFMNAVNWVAQQENLIAIRPREPQDRRINLTAAQEQQIMLLSLLLVPGFVFAAGVYTWWRRR